MFSKIETYFTSWRFPVFMLATLFLSWILILFMAFVPVTDSVWGAFAEDFKVWCFGYDPESGSFQWIYIFMFSINPFILAMVILFVWNEPMKEVFQSPLIIKKHALMAVLLVASVSASFLLMYEVPGEEEFEFRADAIRVSLSAPEFSLINHKEETVSLSDYEGRVVILTSVYASCADTCPMILDQVKRTLNDLTPGEREEVVLMAITMQPEKDTPGLLSQVARFYRLDEYNAHLLTGDADYVNALLDRMNVSRAERPDSADIDHANLFLIIDRDGSLAFRFTLGERQQDWMTQALRVLISEDVPDRFTDLLK
jgi:protein SCO1